MINKRARDIMLEIIKNESMKTSTLARYYGTSERTIRSDLEEIEIFLKEKTNGELVRTHKGAKIVGIDEMLIYKLINEDILVKSTYSNSDRRLEILYYLVSSDYVKLDGLSELMMVSKSTIVNDLEEIRKQSGKVSIVGSNDGIRLAGEESEIRKWTVNMFMDQMDKNSIHDIASYLKGDNRNISHKVYYRLFEDSDFDLINENIEIINAYLPMNISEKEYLLLFGIFSLMLRRQKIGKVITETDKNISSVTAEIISSLTFIDKETDYLAYALYSVCSRLYVSDHGIDTELVDGIVSEIRYLNIFIDFELLKEQLENILVRRELGFRETNSFKLDKTVLGSEEYLAVKKVVRKYGIVHDDVYRIAYHFLINRNSVNSKSVLLISDRDSIETKLLYEKLLSMFYISNIKVIRYFDISKYTDKYDVIISTTHLKHDIDYIQIHPLLIGKDVKQVSAKLDYIIPDTTRDVKNDIEISIDTLSEKSQLEIKENFKNIRSFRVKDREYKSRNIYDYGYSNLIVEDKDISYIQCNQSMDGYIRILETKLKG